jgi:hypothetical protein
MNAEKQIRNAVAEAVAAQGQDSGLTDKILAWFDAVADKSISVNDREAMRKHITILLDATTVNVVEVDIQEDEDNGH